MSFAEFAAHPPCVLVHDPAAAGALAPLSEAADAALEREWLFRSRPLEPLYAEQHRTLVRTLRKSVARVELLSDLIGGEAAFEQARTNPNQVFTRDSLITLPWAPGGYIAARMNPPLRRLEVHAMEAAARLLGLQPIANVPEGLFLEGGDVIPFAREGRRTLLVGYGPRTRFEAVEYLQQALIPGHADEIVAVALSSWRMNLDGGLMPVTADVVLAEPESLLEASLLDARGRAPLDLLGMLRDLGMRVVEVTREESVLAQACNGVCLRDRQFLCYDLCDRVDGLLSRLDVRTLRIPGSELVKGRGGPRCMTRPIYGRDL